MSNPARRTLAQVALLFAPLLLLAPSAVAQDLVLVPRLGLVLGGEGSMDTRCASTPDAMSGLKCPPSSQDTADVSALALGLDLLVDTGAGLSLGGGLLFQTENTVEPVPLGLVTTPSQQPGADPGVTPIPLTISGSDLSAFGLLEYAVALTPTSRIIGRLQGGLFMLFIDDALNDIVADSLYTGWSVGGGVGSALDVQGVGLRGDLLVQYFDLPTIDYTLSSAPSTPPGSPTSLDSSFDYEAFRIMLMLGFEFGRG